MKLVAILTVLVVAGCRSSGAAPATRPSSPYETAALVRHLLIVPGESQVANTGIVYVIDEDRHLLSALAFDPNSKRIIYMESPVALDRIFGSITSGKAAGNVHAVGMITGIEYSAVICLIGQGLDGLYVINHEGRMAVFTYDPAAHRVVIRGAGTITDAFRR